MTEDVKLCMQCLHHPASTRLIGVPCRMLAMPLAEARAICRGDLWEQGHETPIAKKWLRRKVVGDEAPYGVLSAGRSASG